jgi:hypothetical protein
MRFSRRQVQACGPHPVFTDAPAFAQYNTAQQKQMAQDFDSLPPDIQQMLRDCKALGNEVRSGINTHGDETRIE